MLNKAAIVTGGASGIGFAVSRTLAKEGRPVAIVDLSHDLAVEAASLLTRETGTRVIGIAADVADAKACADAYQQLLSDLGEICVLVNNAGFMPPRKGWIEELPLEDFHQMMNVHLGGAVHWCRLVMPAMRAAAYGRIINISSVNGVQPVPHRYTYVTAKKALRGLTEALALDCARAGITVNAIAPGYILTETLKQRAERGLLSYESIANRTPAGRWGKPEEIAHIVRFLASPESGYITGITITADGGLSIRGDANEDLNTSPF